jgi:alpha,alpha-trehalase
VPFHDGNIISQFEGYDQLEEFDWDRYRKNYGNIQRLDRILEAEGDTTNLYKVSKQADVLMLFYLFSSDELRQIFQRLGYPFKYETIP